MPPLMAPHPEASFEILEDEEEAARKGVDTGVGVVPFDKVRKKIEYVNARGEEICAEMEVPLGLAFGEDVERQQLERLEEERIDEAERRRGGKAGKGIEDIRREIVAERQRRKEEKRGTARATSAPADESEAREEELKEEMSQEDYRKELSEDIERMVETYGVEVSVGQNEPHDERVTTQQVNEDERMIVQESWGGGVLDNHAELEPALDEARSLKSYFGETLHEITEAKRHAEEEPERDRRLYYREKGIEDDEWSGAEADERRHDRVAAVPDLALARMAVEEAEAERYNALMQIERKRRRDEEACEGTPAFPVKRRNSLRGAVAERMRSEEEHERNEKDREERLALQGRNTDDPADPDIGIQEEDVYDYPANEQSVYYTYGAEQFDYGDMDRKDAGDYSTLTPLDGDDDLLREEGEEGEEKHKARDVERDGHQVLEEVREEVLMLEGCQSNRKLRPPPPSEDAKPLIRKAERLPARCARGDRRTRGTDA